jgi:signal transduction histidine kinase
MPIPDFWPVSLSLVLVLALAVAALALMLCVGMAWAWRAQRLRTQAAQEQAWNLNQQLLAVQGLLHQQGIELWRTDATHRWTQPTSPGGDQSGSVWWDVLPPAQLREARGLALQERAVGPLTVALPAGQALAPGSVLNAAAPEGESVNCVLQALPLRGLDGRFTGHVGLCQAQPCAAEPSAADSPVAPPSEAFSYTISHDLRSPLRVVEGFARILKEDYGRLLDRIGNDHLERILAAAARMQHMIDALLALSKLSSRPLERQGVNLSQQAGEVCEELRQTHPGRAVSISIEPDLLVQADPTLTRIVLENLLGNAWKYTAKCERAEIRFTRHAQRPQGFTVQDNGAGFDMRFADRLFKPFQRLHSASDFKGHGIGLASVSRIVQRHGGQVWAESAVGQGTRVHFLLAPDNQGQRR